MRSRTKPKGFTLIELMIVLAIIGILAAIAYPSYRDSVRKSRRADAKTALLELASWMERNYTLAYQYDQKKDGTAIDVDALPFKVVPRDGSTPKFYDITLTNLADNTFTLSAVPANDQANDPCQTLTLDQAGAKDVAGGATLTKEECWRR